MRLRRAMICLAAEPWRYAGNRASRAVLDWFVEACAAGQALDPPAVPTTHPRRAQVSPAGSLTSARELAWIPKDRSPRSRRIFPIPIAVGQPLPGMPEICRFFGIVIRMYFLDHAPPHFHAIYSGSEAQVRITPVGLLAGGLPPRALALVVEWATIHQSELLENWRRLHSDEPSATIAPLE